jgi:hypothetical protein
MRWGCGGISRSCGAQPLEFFCKRRSSHPSSSCEDSREAELSKCQDGGERLPSGRNRLSRATGTTHLTNRSTRVIMNYPRRGGTSMMRASKIAVGDAGHHAAATRSGQHHSTDRLRPAQHTENLHLRRPASLACRLACQAPQSSGQQDRRPAALELETPRYPGGRLIAPSGHRSTQPLQPVAFIGCGP